MGAGKHGGASVVNWTENEWYSHHPPKVGGTPPAGAIRRPTVDAGHGRQRPRPSPAAGPDSALRQPGRSPARASGRRPVASSAGSRPFTRPPCAPTPSTPATSSGWPGWTPSSCEATLYSGSQIPGGGPYPNTAPIEPGAASQPGRGVQRRVLDVRRPTAGTTPTGRMVLPLRTGAASFVVYRNGSSTVGQWGRDVTMTPDVVSVRQNLDLLVDNGQAGPRAERRRHHPVGGDARQLGLRVAVRSGGDRRRSPRVRRRARGSTSPTWPTYWPGPVPSGPWSSTSTPTG